MVARARASSSWTVSSAIAFLIPCSATGQRRASVQAHPASPSFFDGLTEEELARVLGRLEHRRFAAGTIMLAAGETLQEMYIVHDGVVDVLMVDRHGVEQDRKSTRLNSSHLGISYAVFC